MHLPDMGVEEREASVPDTLARRYGAPRIDIELLTIVVHPSPYSKRTPLGRSRSSTIRKRWFS